MSYKASTPKGTRDFGPIEMARRDYIFNTIRDSFKLYGYSPIETPAMENLSTLLGKYGEEGDRLLFKVLNSGEPFSKIAPEELEDSNALSLRVCEKGLRYDLTVPLARFVVQHRNNITFPFKRYQIQPVWRADRPQKGRYREFYQCDIDVIGSDSLLNELEMVQIAQEIFKKLGVAITIKINNRKVLVALSQYIGHPDKLIAITTAIDKIEKVGFNNAKSELVAAGISEEGVEMLRPILSLSGSNTQKIAFLKEILSSSTVGLEGVSELEELFNLIESAGVGESVEIDLSLARGLNYYTGAIFEVKAAQVEIGSICGGGRYDNLTGIFGLPGLSGVGISFGADRIYDVLLATNTFPPATNLSTQILFANMGGEGVQATLPLLSKLRSMDITVELFPNNDRLRKQFDYASKRAIPYIAFVGSREIEDGEISLKNLKTGSEIKLPIEELDSIKEKIELLNL
ncbi:MAG: histidine--tRNA ligase [Bacteroidales bacterium]